MNVAVSMLGGAGKRYCEARLVRTYLNMDAIFSDETKQYLEPYDPEPGDTVTFKLRTAKDNVEFVYLHAAGYQEQSIAMTKTDSDDLFDYYTARYPVATEMFRYYFSIEKNEGKFYYNKQGLREAADATYHFKISPGFKTPDWAKGAVMYQIFLDRFCNGDKTNDPVDYEYLYIGRVARSFDWDQAVVPDDVCNFYGGDLQGLMDKMGYLKSLGIEAIYLNPIFVSPSSHKYDAQDYDYVDPHFGVIVNDGGNALSLDNFNNRYATKYMSRTADKANLEASNKLCAQMIAKAHEHGIKVILDGAFNHCGCYHKWMDKPGFYRNMGYPAGAYRDEDSPYHNYFLWYDSDWPNNDCYDSWWGNDNHPKLNFEDSPELYAYIMEVAKKWVSPPYNADGWRLDVAADLGRSPEFNHRFWQDFRSAVKSANPDAIILGEHYGDVSSWVSGGEWDTVMNYEAFMNPLSWFLTGMEKHSEDRQPHLQCDAMVFENTMRYYMSHFNIHGLLIAMNQLSNHDHSRFLTRTNHQVGRLHTRGAAAAEEGLNKAVMMEAVVFQMFWPGAPTIYYGDEAGLAGWHDPDNRRPFPWGREDQLMLELHREAIALRKAHPVTRHGSTEFLWNEYGILSFGRWDDKDKIAVIINNNPWPKEIRLPVWKIGLRKGYMYCALATYDEKVHKNTGRYKVEAGVTNITVPEFSSMVLQL